MIFQDVFIRKPQRSAFNLSHERKFSGDFGYLYPILCLEAVPGDTFKINTEVFVRCAPLIAPIMHRVNVKLNFFSVPYRLVWDSWPDFITGINQKQIFNPATDNNSNYFVTPVPPFWTLTSNASQGTQKLFEDGSLADFLGFPTLRPGTTAQGSTKVQLMPFKAYQKIYNDWYRNQNVEAENNIYSSVGGESAAGLSSILTLRKRMWEKDYYTSALPFAQRGDPVRLPIVDSRFVYDPIPSGQESNPPRTIVNKYPVGIPDNGDVSTHQFGPSVMPQGSALQNSEGQELNIDVSGTHRVITEVGNINDLRIATRLQRWLEINARVGGRYIEQILGHFGVHSSDARLQRAEYLGGWSSPLIVSDVEQTSAFAGSSSGATASTPQGNLAGKGVAYDRSKPVKVFCEEHCFIFGILSIIPRTTYQDGLPKMFQRWYKEDYYFPEFANLGEQEVNKAEVYYNLADENNQSFDRFGFQERFCEYRYIPSSVHGEFKNNLQFWHLGRSFSEQPALNKTFAECNPRNNVFAVLSGANHFYINLINNVKAIRPMPRQAIPTL